MNHQMDRPIATRARRMPEDRVTSSTYFLRSQLERLDTIALREDVPRSVLIRRAVEQLLQEAGV